VQPPIENGAVAVAEGKILRAGTYDDLKEKGIKGEIIDHGEGILMPALVNAHTHLEIPPFTTLPAENFVTWLKAVIEKKQTLTTVQVQQAEKNAHQMLKQAGTGLVGNVKNFPLINSERQINEITFYEFLGLKKEVASKRWPVFENFLKENSTLPIYPAAHAPYSVYPEFLHKIKEIALNRKQILSIHVAESEAENEFLVEGKGALKELLEEKGLLPDNFRPPQKRPVPYLAELGLLTPQTLCVHCVEINEEDIRILQRYGVKICLCPRSNYYLRLNYAPWTLFKQSGLLLCLGTDSLASNQDLNLFKEMVFLYEKNAFSASELLEMSTWKGSIALGQGHKFGTMFPGAWAELIFLPLEGSFGLKELAEAVIYTGAKGRLKWIK
jgi:cytosine/adenosine deaminase-related metal-dependent hydrolase